MYKVKTGKSSKEKAEIKEDEGMSQSVQGGQ